MSALPSGWAETRLGDIVELVRGVTYKKQQASDKPGPGLIPLLRATNVKSDLIFDDEFVFVPESVVRLEQLLQIGDIVVASSSGSTSVVGKSAMLRRQWRGGFGAFCTVLRPKPSMDASYLAAYVASPTVRKRWSSLAAGTNINNLKRQHFEETLVPVAPFAEQRRIVAAIEERFSRIDSADASLCAAQMRLTLFKRGILARSFPVNANERTLESIAAAGKHAITDGPFGSNLKTEHYTSAGPRVIRLQNIGDGEFIDAMAHISSDHFEKLRKHDVLAGDVVIAALGEELPRACMIPEHVPPAIVKADCFRIRLGSDALPAYVVLALNAPQTRQRASRIIHGVGRPRLNLREVRQLSLPIPAIEVQRKIVTDLERQVSIADAMAAEIGRIRLRIAALRHSILADAFAGKLAAQDPSDEPASVLLERVASETATRRSPSLRRRMVAV